MDLFSDLYPIPGGLDPNPTAPRQRICRMCAAEVLLYGFREWWIRERRKGFLDPESEMAKRRDCAEGRECRRQSDPGELGNLSVCVCEVWMVLLMCSFFLFVGSGVEHANECMYQTKTSF
jgi:hypothetical protein